MKIKQYFYVAGCFLSLTCTQSHVEAKKLISQQVGLLNISLGALPQVTARLKLSRSHAHAFCSLLEKQGVDSIKMSKSDIDQSIKKLLDPVRDFFTKITEHKDMIVPLLVESLKDYQLKQSEKTLDQESLLITFFNENGGDVINFFQKKIATQQDFDQVIHELKYFLDDLDDSFSSNVIQAYNKMMDDIHARKAAQNAMAAANQVGV